MLQIKVQFRKNESLDIDRIKFVCHKLDKLLSNNRCVITRFDKISDKKSYTQFSHF